MLIRTNKIAKFKAGLLMQPTRNSHKTKLKINLGTKSKLLQKQSVNY